MSEYAKALFRTYEKALLRRVQVPDYSVHLEVAEGSIKGRGWVLATGLALFEGISRYGDFRSGIKQIREDVHAVERTLVGAAPVCHSIVGRLTSSRSDESVVKNLDSLFRRVERREIAPEEASHLATQLLAEAENQNFKLTEAVRNALGCAPLDPVQTELVERSPLIPAPQKRGKTNAKPAPAMNVRRVRIEIWRDSKTGPQRVAVLD